MFGVAPAELAELAPAELAELDAAPPRRFPVAGAFWRTVSADVEPLLSCDGHTVLSST